MSEPLKIAIDPVAGAPGYFRGLQPAYWLAQTGRHHVAILDTNVGKLTHEQIREAVSEADVLVKLAPGSDFSKQPPEWSEHRGALVVDYDDDVWSWTADPSAKHDPLIAEHEEKLRGVATWLRAADLATTTTPYLAERLLEHGAREVAVCPNAMSLEMLRSTPRPQDLDTESVKKLLGKTPKNRRPTKIVAWTGNVSRGYDCGPMLSGLRRVALVEPDLRVITLGLLDFLKTTEWQGMRNGTEISYFRIAGLTEKGETSFTCPFGLYYEILERMSPDVAVVPMRPSPFNAGKSCITPWSWAMQGVPCVLSRVGPYAEAEKEGFPAIFVEHEKVEEWFDAIRMLLANRTHARDLGERAQKFVLERHCMPKALEPWEKAFARALEIRKGRVAA